MSLYSSPRPIPPDEGGSRAQVNRRNLTADEYRYYLGKLYERRKRQGQRTDLTSAQNEQKLTTAEQVAQEHGVSRETVKRAASFAQDVDTLAEV